MQNESRALPTRKWLLVMVGLAISLAGCGTSAQRTARLAAGSKAIIDPVGGEKTVLLDTSTENTASTFGAFLLIEAGTKVEIESDDDDSPESSDEGRRLVKIFVWDGPDKGQVGWLSRNDLRPTN